MNNQAQRRKGKVKLSKDLKYGNVQLRQSLIEMGEFEDLDRIFQSKK